MTTDVQIPFADRLLRGELVYPAGCHAVIIFADDGVLTRSRSYFIASILHGAKLGTLFFSTEHSEQSEGIGLFSDSRVVANLILSAADWLRNDRQQRHLAIGFFGIGDGAIPVLQAGAQMPSCANAIIVCGGRPEFTDATLSQIEAPSLFLVGGNDTETLQCSEDACSQMRCEAKVEIVPRASRLLDEPGSLACAGTIAAAWFVAQTHIQRHPPPPAEFAMEGRLVR